MLDSNGVYHPDPIPPTLNWLQNFTIAVIIVGTMLLGIVVYHNVQDNIASMKQPELSVNLDPNDYSDWDTYQDDESTEAGVGGLVIDLNPQQPMPNFGGASVETNGYNVAPKAYIEFCETNPMEC